MRYTPAALCVAALLWLFPAAAPARADFIAWSYNWSRTPGTVYADGSTTSFITLTDESQHTAVGDTTIVATNLRTFSDASPNDPAHFTDKKYTLSLSILDPGSGKSGVMHFSGAFNGDLSSQSANIKNTFLNATTQMVVLGLHKFTVTINEYAPPGPQSQTNAGSIAAHAIVRVDDIQTVPEPSGLLLAALGGLPLLGLLGRRR
jgi:hypothetical protein